jgi:hypothetical protein
MTIMPPCPRPSTHLPDVVCPVSRSWVVALSGVDTISPERYVAY